MKNTRIPLILLLTLMCVSTVVAEGFRSPESRFKLTITKVERKPGERVIMIVTARLEAIGKGPIAFSQDQFSARISTAKDSFLYIGDAIFDKKASKIIKANPDKPVVFAFTVGSNRFGDKKPWYNLPDGNYELRVGVNSGKRRLFDYQWLGTGSSKAWKYAHKK